jgi:hypothetical protein
MTLPDNRVRFPTSRIDFDNDVGIASQGHDTYPAPGQQPRFDWMRMFLIGLLSNQSSYSEPTQYRDGTIWFDLNENALKVRSDGAWVGISESIRLDVDADGTPVTLQDLYVTMRSVLGYKPTASFSGSSSHDGITVIPIPEALRAAAGAGSRPMVWINGLLVDPRGCEYVGGTEPVSIRLVDGSTIDSSDTFTVLMIAIDSTLFSSEEVTL